MKPLRLALLGAAVMAGLLVVALGLLAFPALQTGLARHWLASLPGLRASVGAVSVGWGRIEVTDLLCEGPAGVLRVPRASADADVVDAILRRRLRLDQVEATGWSLQLAPGATVSQLGRQFAGLMAGEVRRMHLAGQVALPGAEGPFGCRISSGAGGEAGLGRCRVELTLPKEVAPAGLDALAGEARLAQSPGGAWERLDLRLAPADPGRKPDWTLEWSVWPVSSGESHGLVLRVAEREVARVTARQADAGPWEGDWRLDVLAGDLARMGRRPWPVGELTGQGSWSGTALTNLRMAGHFSAALPDPGAVLPALAGWEPVRLAVDFDANRRDHVVRVARAEITVAATTPVATLRSLQPFEFDANSWEIRPAEPLQELLGLRLDGVPVMWLERFLPGLRLRGGPVRGDLSVRPLGQGVAVRSVGSVLAGPLEVAIAGRPVLLGAGLTAVLTGDYSPAGWQVELRDVKVLAGEAELVRGGVKVGRIAGPDQSVKLAGSLGLDVAPWQSQPLAVAGWRLSAGEAKAEFRASLGEKSQWQVRLVLEQLAAGPGRPLPSLVAQVRADGQGGRWEADVPVEISADGRRSDLRWAGTVAPGAEGVWRIEGQLTGDRVEWVDVVAWEGLARAFPWIDGTGGAGVLWGPLRGEVAFRVGELRMPEAGEFTEFRGHARAEPASLRLEMLELDWIGRGRLKGSVNVNFRPGDAKPWELVAAGVGRDIDLGAWFRRPGAAGEPLLEGRGEVTGQITARARVWRDLAEEARGEFELNSKSGVFRGLRTAIAPPADPSRGLAGLFASAGSLVSGSLSGRRQAADIAGRPEAVAEIARGLGEIAYDQLSVRVSHDAAFNTILRDFNLISPQLRLSGYGTALHKPGRTFWDDALAMKFTLRARGRMADLLQHLGVLDAQKDNLGYNVCMFPAPLGGSLLRPDATELRRVLVGLAEDRGGLGERAADLLNRLLGNGR
jgi:hypothetical protein